MDRIPAVFSPRELDDRVGGILHDMDMAGRLRPSRRVKQAPVGDDWLKKMLKCQQLRQQRSQLFLREVSERYTIFLPNSMKLTSAAGNPALYGDSTTHERSSPYRYPRRESSACTARLET